MIGAIPEGGKRLPQLRFIEAMLVHYGEVRRCHLMGAFGYNSPISASSIFSDFRARFPHAMRMDGLSKSWAVCPGFVPVLLEVSAKEYLQAAQLMAVQQIVQDEDGLQCRV